MDCKAKNAAGSYYAFMCFTFTVNNGGAEMLCNVFHRIAYGVIIGLYEKCECLMRSMLIFLSTVDTRILFTNIRIQHDLVYEYMKVDKEEYRHQLRLRIGS